MLKIKRHVLFEARRPFWNGPCCQWKCIDTGMSSCKFLIDTRPRLENFIKIYFCESTLFVITENLRRKESNAVSRPKGIEWMDRHTHTDIENCSKEMKKHTRQKNVLLISKWSVYSAEWNCKWNPRSMDFHPEYPPILLHLIHFISVCIHRCIPLLFDLRPRRCFSRNLPGEQHEKWPTR